MDYLTTFVLFDYRFSYLVEEDFILAKGTIRANVFMCLILF